jgi:hypothetical protein
VYLFTFYYIFSERSYDIMTVRYFSEVFCILVEHISPCSQAPLSMRTIAVCDLLTRRKAEWKPGTSGNLSRSTLYAKE